jgi:hypothetical protein
MFAIASRVSSEAIDDVMPGSLTGLRVGSGSFDVLAASSEAALDGVVALDGAAALDGAVALDGVGEAVVAVAIPMPAFAAPAA